MVIDGIHEKEIFSDKFPFRILVSTSARFSYPPHWHRAVELVYAVGNFFDAKVDGCAFCLSPGDILFIPGGGVHGFETEKDGGKRIFINFEMPQFEGEAGLEQIKSRLSTALLITPGGSSHSGIEREIKMMLEENAQRENAFGLSLMARAIDILVLLCRSEPGPQNAAGGLKRMTGLEKLGKALGFIEEHYREEIELDDVAGASGFSKYYFCKLFKDVTEKNFHEYLNEFRIRKAEMLLMDAENSVASAAYSAGFNSLATFERIFKKVKGCTPMQYRKLGA